MIRISQNYLLANNIIVIIRYSEICIKNQRVFMLNDYIKFINLNAFAR